MSSDGFLRPERGVRLSLEQQAAFSAICPGEGLALPVGIAPHQSDLWGPYRQVATAHATDPEVRHRGASGGALTALLIHLLDTERVDAVVHVGASTTEPIANRTIVSRSRSDVLEAAGSRYAPSSPLDGIEKLLDGTTRYVFCGKPCDASALRQMMTIDERVRRQFRYITSFFCAGVPSQAGAEEVLRVLGVEPSSLDLFRYRGNGWPGRATAQRLDGTSESMSYHESWGGILARYVQPRCKICPDGVGAFADIVFADAWETDEAGYPQFEERAGSSLVISRTQHGDEILDDAIAAGVLAATELPIERIEAMQPGQVMKASTSLVRIAALKSSGRRVPRFRGFALTRNARRLSPRQVLKEFGGTVRRRVLGRMNA